VAFYVPLGPRGILFRIGTFLIGVLGGWVYWRASRRRGLIAPPLPLVFDLAEPELIP
jgi:hypothetical protein